MQVSREYNNLLHALFFFSGQLGDNSNAIQRPSLVSQDNFKNVGIQQIVTGPYHALVLTSKGSIFGWGQNVIGSASEKAIIQEPTPTVLPHDNITIVHIAAGYDHSLAVDSSMKKVKHNNYCIQVVLFLHGVKIFGVHWAMEH